MLLFLIALPKVIDLPTIVIAIAFALFALRGESKRFLLLFGNAFKTIANAVVRRVITIWEAIQERSYDYKTNTKNVATTFAIANLEER